MNIFKKPLKYIIRLLTGKEINLHGKLTLFEKVILLEGEENYIFSINNIELIKEDKQFNKKISNTNLERSEQNGLH